MKKITLSLAAFLTLSLSTQAQVDGVTFKKIKPSESLREYEVAFFGDKPVIAHNIRPQYVDLNYMHHIFQQDYMTVDSLLGSNDIANKLDWYRGTRRREANGNTERDAELRFGYEFDEKLKSFLGSNLSSELVQRFFVSTNDQFKIKKAHEDFLGSKTISNIQKDLSSFKPTNDIIYMAYGAVGSYDFAEKKLQIFINNTRYIKFPEPIKQNEGSSLECKIEMSEEEAQAITENKYFRALISVQPSELEVTTIRQFLKEPLKNRYMRMVLNGNEIELIGNRNSEEKIMKIDANSCVTR